MIERISKENTKHLYYVETMTRPVLIEANNRNQAGAIARKAGFDVKSVNMEG